MATIREYFQTDFPHLLSSHRTFKFQRGDEVIDVVGRLHYDFDANAKFVSCMIPACPDPVAAAGAAIRDLKPFLALADGVGIGSGFVGEDLADSAVLVFAGSVFIYTEQEMPPEARRTLSAEAALRGVRVRFRSERYAAERSRLEKPIAFISHDSRDKEAYASPIAMGLSKSMCPVWYDEFSLKVGDRLRQSIERGLKETKKCVLVLSPNFLSNPGWTREEFDGVFMREQIEKNDVLLPVWCGVTRQQVFEYSPSLANRVAVVWDGNVDEVVRKLHVALR